MENFKEFNIETDGKYIYITVLFWILKNKNTYISKKKFKKVIKDINKSTPGLTIDERKKIFGIKKTRHLYNKLTKKYGFFR